VLLVTVVTARTSATGGATMANKEAIAPAGARATRTVVRSIGVADLKDAVAKGYSDFTAMPTHLIFLGIVYPVLILVVARAYAGYEILPLVFPLLAGYTLIGPLVALGTYELSRRREQGRDTSRWHAFEVLRSPSLAAIVILGLVLMLIYFVWLFAARAIYGTFFGSTVPASVLDFAGQVLTTGPGWGLIVVGSGVGFLFAVVVFSLSVVSFPLLLDRDTDVVTAVGTSMRVVLANPMTMGLWGLFIAASLLIGSLPLFVGLAVVLPVLGHSTWHLYRKVVEVRDSF
jgi:uncharacterized membrane protein